MEFLVLLLHEHATHLLVTSVGVQYVSALSARQSQHWRFDQTLFKPLECFALFFVQFVELLWLAFLEFLIQRGCDASKVRDEPSKYVAKPNK